MDKKVSVIIPVYNHDKYVEDAIESVFNQSYKNIEVIVLNDGSTDNSHEVIVELRKKYDFIYINKNNEGLSKTLQEGLKLCTGDFISPLASDDMWLENKIEKQVNYMNFNNSCVACCAYVNTIDENNHLTSVAFQDDLDSFDFERIMFEGYKIPPATILIRRRCLSERNYRDDLKVEDLFLWLTLTKDNGTIDILPCVLANYRIHSTNTTGNLALIAKYHHMTIDFFKNESIYKKSKNEWRKFSFRQLSRDYKKEAIKLISIDPYFLFSKEYFIGMIKILFFWK
ncbi:MULTISPECIES: glycosyltransferase family 2 protein [Pectobacterium]|uniref:Glycosyl transferase family 2 n=1 Tax=Pectobacterium carotovorum subsp. carotovorum (strain PC1) TaxID=561230 RepID=C6DCK3_PECCP|nr:glycosyltransferase [Pectobacterium carotovorum]ACT12353.1 glycosyl transferase family 2 [Pectobacterium carotovorum subsp. carotovorum PC1]